MEYTKVLLFLSVPIWFGYYVGRNERVLEAVKYYFPSVVSDRQGPHGRQLRTLEDEYRRVALDEQIDIALAELRSRKNQDRT